LKLNIQLLNKDESIHSFYKKSIIDWKPSRRVETLILFERCRFKLFRFKKRSSEENLSFRLYSLNPKQKLKLFGGIDGKLLSLAGFLTLKILLVKLICLKLQDSLKDSRSDASKLFYVWFPMLHLPAFKILELHLIYMFLSVGGMRIRQLNVLHLTSSCHVLLLREKCLNFTDYCFFVPELKLSVKNFKSIKDVELKLTPITVLIGPPAAGKSNLLDAIVLLGYLDRFMFLEEYGNNASYMENPLEITRASEVLDYFRYFNSMERISLTLEVEKAVRNLEAYFEAGSLKLELNNVKIPWNFGLRSDSMGEVRNAVAQAVKELLNIKIYSFDRFRASILNHFHLKTSTMIPPNILREDGMNAFTIARRTPEVLIRLNEVLKKVGLELKMLRSGQLVVFDHHYEVKPSSISDSIYRIFYILLALNSAVNFSKLKGFEGRSIIALEEPESQLFPQLLDLIIEGISKFKNLGYVVLTTHNPLLVSKLGDAFKDLMVYYVFRGEDGSSSFVEVNVEKMAENLIGSEDLLLLDPEEVLKRCTGS